MLNAIDVVAMLPDRDVFDEEIAYEIMDKIKRVVAPHVDTVLARLDDTDWYVRREAMDILALLEPAMLAQHADAVITRLEDSSEYVRRLALQTLGKLEPAMLAQHVDAMVTRLEDS